MTSAASIRRDAQAGLTLVEMLIVLVIMGIATSAAVLSVDMVGRDRKTEDEAARLAAQLNLAVDEGLVSRKRLALFWTGTGYEVKAWAGGGWRTPDTPRLAAAHDLPASLTLRRMDGASGPVDMAEDGLGPAVSLELSGAGSAWVVAFDGFSATTRPGGSP
jgi:general secretion pathway protein H